MRIAEKVRDRERATVADERAAIAGPPTPAKHPSPDHPDSEALLPLGEQTRTGPYQSWSSSHPFMTDQQTFLRQRRGGRFRRSRRRISEKIDSYRSRAERGGFSPARKRPCRANTESLRRSRRTITAVSARVRTAVRTLGPPQLIPWNTELAGASSDRTPTKPPAASCEKRGDSSRENGRSITGICTRLARLGCGCMFNRERGSAIRSPPLSTSDSIHPAGSATMPPTVAIDHHDYIPVRCTAYRRPDRPCSQPT